MNLGIEGLNQIIRFRDCELRNWGLIKELPMTEMGR